MKVLHFHAYNYTLQRWVEGIPAMREAIRQAIDEIRVINMDIHKYARSTPHVLKGLFRQKDDLVNHINEIRKQMNEAKL